MEDYKMNMIRMYPRAAQSVFSNLFNEMLSETPNNECRRVPAANIIDTEKSFEISLVVPGVDKKDIQINLEKDVLNIKYEAPEMADDRNFTRREFENGSFCRSFILPDSVDREKISARHENGILSLELPRKEAEVKVQREISIA